MKIRIRNKKVVIAVFAIFIACSFIASAALLSMYGKVTTTATAKQSVVIDGLEDNTEIPHAFTVFGGCTKFVKHKITNRACVEAPIGFETTIKPWADPIGIGVNYYVMDGWSHLRLENKDPTTWQVIKDDYYADFYWNPCCPTLNWEIEGVFMPDTEYVLIYYADQPDRFTVWGGAPALLIGSFTSTADGSFFGSGNSNINKCLPMNNDWNIGPDADYTDSPDEYTHGKGAKIWLVPTAIYNGINKELTTWVPEQILFETDLIFYGDCDLDISEEEYSYLYPYFEYETPVSGYTMQPGEEVCLFIEYIFDVAIDPKVYEITTKVVPS